jgi:hypothetical protein
VRIPFDLREAEILADNRTMFVPRQPQPYALPDPRDIRVPIDPREEEVLV